MELKRKKNTATVLVFPVVDADGDTVPGITGFDVEYLQWNDGSSVFSFSDVVGASVTEIGSTGVYRLALSQTILNADYVYVLIKITVAPGSTTPKTQHFLINTKYAPSVDANGNVLQDHTGKSLTQTERNDIASTLLLRDWTLLTDSVPARCLLNAVRFLRNRWTVAGSTLTVYKEDDVTSAWTAAVTLTAGNPVSQVDPN